jgi:galactonate dehydratase
LYPYRAPAHFQLVDHVPEAEVENGQQLGIPDRPGLGINLVPDRVRPLWTEVGP